MRVFKFKFKFKCVENASCFVMKYWAKHEERHRLDSVETLARSCVVRRHKSTTLNQRRLREFVDMSMRSNVR